MEPIHVPRPPKEAFNKSRPVSDLIRKQIEHFKHLEHKLPDDVRKALPQHHVVTEDDAARYIAPMTRLLLSKPVTEAPMRPAPIVLTPGRPRAARKGLSIAAGAAKDRGKKGSDSKPAKKRASRSRKGKKG